MTPLHKNLLSSVLFITMSLSSFIVNATNGYFAHGYGARSKAMAGTGVDLAQGFIVGSYAHSFANGRFSLGVSPIFAVQTFKAKGLNSFGNFSSDPQHLSDKGRSWSYGVGFRVGGQAELLPGLHLGAAYKSRICMTQIDRYAGLFAEHGGFDIPDSFNVGLSWAINNAVTTAFDIEHIRYSEIQSVGNPFQPLLQGVPLGSDNASGSAGTT